MKRISEAQFRHLEALALDRARSQGGEKARLVSGEGLESFTRRTMPEYEWNWHHKVIVENLEALERGDIRRLMIFAPPRSGKSELVSRRFPAWVLGRHPEWNVIASSHTTELAAEMCGDVQDIIDSPEYREVFPGTRLGNSEGGGRKARRTQRVFKVQGRRGSYRGVGTRVRISGLGFDLGILDDPIGDADDAYSEAYRRRIWNWYTTTFRSRKSRNNRILLTVTRWHPDDIAGRLLRLAAENPQADQWTVVRFPALAEGPDQRHAKDLRQEGEPLWPARVGQFDLAGIQSDRASMPAFQFQALMQQRPSAAEGAVFQERWFGTWKPEGVTYRLTDGRPLAQSALYRIIVVDPAATDKASSDYTAIGVFGIAPGGEVLILDMLRDRWPIEKVSEVVKGLWNLYRPLYVAFEGVGFQKAMAALTRAALPHVDVRLVEPQGKSKLTRALPAIARAEAGKVYLPTPAPAWVRPFLEEVTAFTGNNDLHDDQCDCLAYAVALAGGSADALGRPLIF
jgi:predicted phage terminase large subunit-like protein